jgi:hypothetical protein
LTPNILVALVLATAVFAAAASADLSPPEVPEFHQGTTQTEFPMRPE